MCVCVCMWVCVCVCVCNLERERERWVDNECGRNRAHWKYSNDRVNMADVKPHSLTFRPSQRTLPQENKLEELNDTKLSSSSFNCCAFARQRQSTSDKKNFEVAMPQWCSLRILHFVGVFPRFFPALFFTVITELFSPC